MEKLQSVGKINPLHTIVSRETITPSSPTPPLLKTHNLSLLDQFAPDMHTPIVFFYRNYTKGDTNILKQSLSQSLTQYYPFAGRIPTPPTPCNYIDCNDEGVEFVEAFIDSKMDDFIQENEQAETLDLLFPYSFSSPNSCPNLLYVKLNHFADGGVAMAVSMSHKLADGATIANFIDHWATVTRRGTPINPCFISSSTSDDDKTLMPKFVVMGLDKVKYATRRFVFPNSKLNELKKKVIVMGKVTANPTRIEVLTSILYKHAVSAFTRNSGCYLQPSNLSSAVNMRNKFVDQSDLEITAGNLFTLAIAKMEISGEINLSEVIAKVRKGKMEFEGLRSEQEVVEKLAKTYSILEGDIYYSSSLCRIPFFEVDFGWGKPVEVTLRIPDLEEKTFMLMDTPSRDGIKALVHLPEEEMSILEKDKEFLTYVQDY